MELAIHGACNLGHDVFRKKNAHNDRLDRHEYHPDCSMGLSNDSRRRHCNINVCSFLNIFRDRDRFSVLGVHLRGMLQPRSWSGFCNTLCYVAYRGVCHTYFDEYYFQNWRNILTVCSEQFCWIFVPIYENERDCGITGQRAQRSLQTKDDQIMKKLRELIY